MNKLYREDIIEYSKNPPHSGRLQNPTVTQAGDNPLCGDSIVLDLLIKNDTLKSIGFEAKGCAISKAAVGILSEAVMGKSIPKIKAMKSDEILSHFDKSLSPSRVKCALLGFDALKRAVSKVKK